MDLPDIPTSVAFWAGIATLGSAAGAWFTFAATARNSRQETFRGIQNLLVGLNAELVFVREWASGGEGDAGYVLPKTKEEVAKQKPEWFNPSRYIFTFQTPILQNFTLSPYVRHLAPIVQPLVRLNYSFRRLLDLHADYRAFANSNPVLYASLFKKVTVKDPNNKLSPEEQDYANVLFEINLIMHHTLIGGEKSSDELCLYKAYRSAKSAVEQFERKLRRESLPWWFWILHTCAACFAVDGGWQVLRWFSVLK